MNPNPPQMSILLYLMNARIGDPEIAHPSHRQISIDKFQERLTAKENDPLITATHAPFVGVRLVTQMSGRGSQKKSRLNLKSIGYVTKIRISLSISECAGRR